MNAKEIIEKLRIQFNELVKQEPLKMMDATLIDGTTIQITDMVIGGVVSINGIPAPVGEYELNDGNTIVVGDNGAITEIKPEEPQPEMPEPVDMSSKFSAFELSTNEKFASYENKFASYESKFADYEVKLSKAYDLIDGLINLSKQLAETPTGTPDIAVAKQNNFKEDKKPLSYDILFS